VKHLPPRWFLADQLWTTLCDRCFPPWIWNIYLWIPYALSPFAPKKCTTKCCWLVTHLKLLKPASEHAHARLLSRLSWCWTVLLSNDTHRKLINIHYSCFTSIYDLFTSSYIYELQRSLLG
jgi:hypothetical protein